jgi:hypothetical protein
MSQVDDKIDNDQNSSGILKQLLEMIRCALGNDENIYKEPICLSCAFARVVLWRIMKK